MSIFSKLERKVEDGVEGAAQVFEKSALTPVQITKKAEKQMKREKVVGAGRQIAPTLYTCLVSPEDDSKLFGYYPTLAGEVETYLLAKAEDYGFSFDCKPLVRFVPDPELRKGKFDVIAELVASPIVAELRAQENERYGIATKPAKAPRTQNPSTAQPSNVSSQKNPRSVRDRTNDANFRNSAMNSSHMPSNAQNPAPRVKAPSIDELSSSVPHVGEGMQTNQNDDRFSGLDLFNDDADFSNYDEGVKDDENINRDFLSKENFDVSSEKTSVVQNVVQPNLSYQPIDNVYFYDEENDIAYSLSGKVERIGRESTNEIVISDINASRTHAEVHMEPTGEWVINDLGSTNGLFVNGQKVKTAVLRDADMVLIGTTRLEFQNL